MKDLYDVIIIGGGPAGLTAAIYTSRAFLKTLIIAGNPPGGQLTTTTDVENFPGFPEGVMGPELISNMREQALRFESEIVDENVSEVLGSFQNNFTVKTENSEYKGKTIIIASGASAKWLELESEQKLRGKGVSACATCDGFFFKGKVVAVVGGGDASMEEATFLTKFAEKVYILVRKDKDSLKASKIMQERAQKNPKIEFLFNTEVKEVLGETSVESLKIINNKTSEEKIMKDVKGLFVAIGHEPNTDFLKGFIKLDERGYIMPIDQTNTEKKGVFVAGDVSDYKYRQAITAAGFGCMAALNVEKFLAQNEDDPEHPEK